MRPRALASSAMRNHKSLATMGVFVPCCVYLRFIRPHIFRWNLRIQPTGQSSLSQPAQLARGGEILAGRGEASVPKECTDYSCRYCIVSA